MRIYWKMFAGFWLATFLMISAVMLAGHLAGSGGAEGHGPPHRLLRVLERSLRQGGVESLVVSLQRYPGLREGSVVVVDDELRPVYPARIPLQVRRRLEELGAGDRGRGLRRLDGIYFMRPVVGPGGEAWRLILRLPPRWLRPFVDRPLLRYGTALAVSGVVCYLLALLFTRRLERLGGTVRQLADGHLDARAQWALGRSGGDEIQGLARDFNQMADRLQNLVAGQERLIKGVSHELRSPLARMHLLLALARRKVPEAACPELDRLEIELDRLGRIVSDLLLLPRLEQRAELLDEVIDLGGLLGAVLEDLGWPASSTVGTAAAADGVSLAWHVPAGECLVRGRATLLRSAFENILANARRHAPAGSAIDVTLRREGRHWVTTVRDRGPGVAAQHLERIFEPFFRDSAAREREAGGVGLGLSLVRRVVDAHGGSVAAHNAAPGLVLRVALPALAPLDAVPGAD